MLHDLETFANRFADSRPCNGGYTARCPAHHDEHSSLSIGVGSDGKLLVHCHAGCAAAEVVAGIGLTLADLMGGGDTFSGNGTSIIVQKYNYQDECGELLYQALRLFPKSFRQRRPDGNGGWTWNLNGVRRVLFCLPELLAADPAQPVFIVEGEKDVERLRELGLIATCNSGGAKKWQEKYSTHLQDRVVCILPDNDPAGHQHARQVAGSLRGVAASVKILSLPDLPDKGDVSDWFDAGHEVAELKQLTAAAPEWNDDTPAEQPQAPALNEKVVNMAIVNGKKTPLSMQQIIEVTREQTGDWPRRVGDALFVHDAEHGIAWLKGTSAIFGFLQSAVGAVEWTEKEGFVQRSEFYSEAVRTAPAYRTVEVLPHDPPFEEHYYACDTIPPGDGEALRALLDRFSPETIIDRDLIQAAFMTPAWGGPPGSRPCFLITSSDGRGSGKTTVATVAGQIWGGVLSFSQNEDINKIKTRLLSPEALVKRVALLDNIKSHRFSWGELEAMVTATEIGGHRMFVGEGTRPNTLTWFLTLNGASLSTDMAQRAVVIRVRKPAYSHTWEEETRQFVEANRPQLIGDLIGCLRAERFEINTASRWGTWERDILLRLPEPGDAQATIAERRTAVDVEEDEARILEDFFAEQLERLRYDPRTEQVFIPSSIAARWFNWAANDSQKTAAVSRILKQLIGESRLPHIRENRCGTWGKGYVWTGEEADLDDSIRTDIETRISTLTK